MSDPVIGSLRARCAAEDGPPTWGEVRYLLAALNASRAAALEEAVAACEKVARDAAENGLSKPFNFVDGAYHAAEAVSALAGRGA